MLYPILQFQYDSLIELLKAELIPALRFELDQILDKKLADWFQRLTDRTETLQAPFQHCKTHCKCQTLHFNFSDDDNVHPDACAPGHVIVNGDPLGNLGSRFHHVNGAKNRFNSSTDSSPCSSPSLDVDRPDRIFHNPVYPVEIERHVISHIEPSNG